VNLPQANALLRKKLIEYGIPQAVVDLAAEEFERNETGPEAVYSHRFVDWLVVKTIESEKEKV